MKNIVTIIGSPRGYKSRTYEISNKILEGLKNKNINISSKIFVLSELEINKCIGCIGCFAKCSSCVAFRDDIDIIEKSMFNADLIIFGSPVYAHNVTGEMKNFVDRITHYFHIMRFAGKYGLTISTSSSNGNVFVDNYLLKVMENLGICVIGQIDYMEYGRFEEKSITECIDNIIAAFEDTVLLPSSDYKEQLFKIYKKAYFESYQKSIMNNNMMNNQEACYWHDNGYFDYDSFEQLFKVMKNN